MKFIRERIKAAESLIEAVSARKNSLRKISLFILSAQREFFEGRTEGVFPMRMKDAARATGMSESTVSRAVAGKYIDAETGIYPMKYFFSGKSGERVEKPVAAVSVKEKIAGIIKGESAEKPLTDAEIKSILERNGIVISRRTVAKYRESAGILPAYLRKSI